MRPYGTAGPMSQVTGDILRAALDAATHGFIIGDADGLITFCNSAAARMFGRPERDLLAQPLATLLSGAVNDRTVECVARHHDGHGFPVEVSISRWTDERGTFSTVL